MARRHGALLWIVPEARGGIHSYSMSLWPAIREAWRARGREASEPLIVSGHDRDGLRRALERCASARPEVIHIQHEFGLFGSKLPFLYRFPEWVSRLREAAPRARVCATAHTVLGVDYRYEWRGRGWQAPLRGIANLTWVPLARRTWLQGTWGALDGVIVHSRLQGEAILASALREREPPRCRVIPHFVPRAPLGRRATAPDHREPVILIFGFFSPEKGQDIMIRAFARLKARARLILAGGVRRPQDQAYHDSCVALIRSLGLADRVTVTGFVPDEAIDACYEVADLVVAPFRETSGSGSLAQAFARGAAVLASDLPLNREIAEREAGALGFFRAGDDEDCARAIDRLLADTHARAALREAAARYAQVCLPERIAEIHADFYESLG